ncbi:MAG: PilZ domain-containing protein [Nitrospirota bacterium]
MPEQQLGSRSDVDARKNRFLMLVEHDSHELSYLSTLLQKFNYPSFKAVTAREALETVTAAVPFLVITSLELPDMHGIPLIAVSKKEDAGIRQHCFDLGAVGCLYHPVDPETLYRIVQVAVEKNPRSCMRIRTVQPVKVNDTRHDSFYGAYTLDLSKKGMFLRTVHSAALHSQLLLELDLNEVVIPLEAEVLYCCHADEGPYKESGIGLKFTQIKPKDQDYIDQFIKEKIARGVIQGTA